MAADEFTWQPSNQSGFARAPRVAGIDYDDGYAQETKGGINNSPLVGNFVFNNITFTVAKAIDDFLDGKGGYQSFLWTPPSPWDTQRRWKVKDWGWIYTGGVITGVRATFKQCFQ